MKQHTPADGVITPLPATHGTRKSASVNSLPPDDRIVRFCQVPPKPRPALLVEIVALPNVGKSTTMIRVGEKLAKAGYLVYIMNNRALPILGELKELGAGVTLLPQSRLVQYAGVFRVLASEVRKLRTHFNVVLVEHFRGFFRAFESSGAADPEADRIVENALRGVRRADLTFYLAAPPSLAMERNKGRLTKEGFIRMYRSLESLAKPEAWHRVPVLGRSEDDIAEECARVVIDRLNARFYTRAAATIPIIETRNSPTEEVAYDRC